MYYNCLKSSVILHKIAYSSSYYYHIMQFRILPISVQTNNKLIRSYRGFKTLLRQDFRIPPALLKR